jgi:hypothetical protein
MDRAADGLKRTPVTGMTLQMNTQESFRFGAMGLLKSMRWVRRGGAATPRAFKQKTTELGAMADYWSPKQLGDLVDSEFTRWAAVTAKMPVD